MTAEQYRAALKKLDLTIVGSAPIFGVSRRMAQAYASDAPIPAPLAKLIWLMLRHDIGADEVEHL